jgi:hypothetical protein
MEMKRITAGKLRAIGYDRSARRLRVELDTGTVIDYSGVGEEIWRRLSTSNSAWSFYRDNIEEEFAAETVIETARGNSPKKPNPLDDLFKK